MRSGHRNYIPRRSKYLSRLTPQAAFDLLSFACAGMSSSSIVRCVVAGTRLVFVNVKQVKTPQLIVDAFFADAQLPCCHCLIATLGLKRINQRTLFNFFESLPRKRDLFQCCRLMSIRDFRAEIQILRGNPVVLTKCRGSFNDVF